MTKSCPECGKFMKLVPYEDVGKESYESYMWWSCSNDWRHTFEVEPAPALEYQWLWDCEGIPQELLIEVPAVREEYIEMWNRLPKALQRQYVEQSPDVLLGRVG